jgi:N-acetylglucosamine-6-phosphate deacetylase
MVAMAFALAPGRVALITDASGGHGVGDGAYALGDLEVTVTGGVATIRGTDTIAGSTLTQDVALRNSVAAGVPVAAAVAALTTTPERLLGLPEWRLQQGVHADLVLVDRTTGALRPL